MGVVATLRREFSFMRGNYLILVLSWILMDFAGEIPGTYYSLYILALGGTGFIIGLISAASFLSLAAVQFPGGYLADKHGRRWLVSTMTFGVTFSFLLYAFAPSWHFILIAVVVNGLCLVYRPALNAMIADSLPPERRGMGYSIINLISSVSTTPGPAIAGLLYLNYGLVDGMRIAYLIVFGLYLLASILRIRLIETVDNPSRITLHDFVSSYSTAFRESLHVFQVVPRSVVFLLAIELLGTVSFAMMMPFIVVYAIEVLGITEIEWSLLLIFLFVAMIASALPAGKLIDKVGRKLPMMFSYALVLPSILLFLFGDFLKVLISMVLFGLSQVLGMSSHGSLQADLVPKEQRGKVMGFNGFVSNICMALASIAGGILYSISPQLLFIISMLFMIPTFLMVLFLVKEPEKRQE